MRGSFYFNVNNADLNKFDADLSVVLTKLGNGSKKALVEACEEILEESLQQVPVQTGTLAESAYYEITGHYKTGWSATVGYGGAYDPINPKTGKPASSYMLAVHENLSAHHPIGKAKFLEDPVRDYAARKFPRTVFKYAQESLASISS